MKTAQCMSKAYLKYILKDFLCQNSDSTQITFKKIDLILKVSLYIAISFACIMSNCYFIYHLYFTYIILWVYLCIRLFSILFNLLLLLSSSEFSYQPPNLPITHYFILTQKPSDVSKKDSLIQVEVLVPAKCVYCP